MENLISLDVLKPGQQARICALETSGSIRRRLLDVGLVPGTIVECIGKSPSGDPTAFLVRGAVIALRSEDCKKIKGVVYGTYQKFNGCGCGGLRSCNPQANAKR